MILRGDCNDMAAATEGSDGVEIWQISTTVVKFFLTFQTCLSVVEVLPLAL